MERERERDEHNFLVVQVKELEAELNHIRLTSVDQETQLRGKITSLEVQLMELNTARQAQQDQFRHQLVRFVNSTWLGLWTALGYACGHLLVRLIDIARLGLWTSLGYACGHRLVRLVDISWLGFWTLPC